MHKDVAETESHGSIRPITSISNTLPEHWRELLEGIWNLNRVHNSDDLDRCFERFKTVCQNKLKGEVRIHHFSPGETINHWIIPPRWNLKSYSLTGPNGEIIATHSSSPLAVACYSQSVDTRLTLDELKAKVISRSDLPDAYSFIFRGMYRHWEKNWQLSLPFSVLSQLQPGTYHVKIDAEFSNAPMPVFEYELKGQTDKIIFLAGHIDHPGMINDSLSGCLSSFQVIEELERRIDKPKYTYRVLLVPEIIGSAVYLKRFEDVIPKTLFSFCSNMTSHDAPLAMCKSKSENSLLDRALQMALWESGKDFLVGGFHEYPDCGDEISFDAVGYKIPSPTLSRRGESFTNYHTSRDDLSAFLAPAAQARHQEVVTLMTRALEIIEQNFCLDTDLQGNPCLSNPSLDLYLNTSNLNNVLLKENLMVAYDGRQVDLRNFMEFFLDALGTPKKSVLEIAFESKLPFDFVRSYAQKFCDKGIARASICTRREVLRSEVSTSLSLAGLVDEGGRA